MILPRCSENYFFPYNSYYKIVHVLHVQLFNLSTIYPNDSGTAWSTSWLEQITVWCYMKVYLPQHQVILPEVFSHSLIKSCIGSWNAHEWLAAWLYVSQGCNRFRLVYLWVVYLYCLTLAQSRGSLVSNILTATTLTTKVQSLW